MRIIEELVKIGVCPNFQSADLQENNIEEKKMRLALNLLASCEHCKQCYDLLSSPEVHEKPPWLDRLAVNLQAVLAFSRLGRGYKAIKMIETVSFAKEM